MYFADPESHKILSRLRQQQDSLAKNISQLNDRHGHIVWILCQLFHYAVTGQLLQPNPWLRQGLPLAERGFTFSARSPHLHRQGLSFRHFPVVNSG